MTRLFGDYATTGGLFGYHCRTETPRVTLALMLAARWHCDIIDVQGTFEKYPLDTR